MNKCKWCNKILLEDKETFCDGHCEQQFLDRRCAEKIAKGFRNFMEKYGEKNSE